MKLALVGWAADSGVGRELIDALRHLPVAASYIIHNKNKPTRMDLIEDHEIFMAEGKDPTREMAIFLDKYKPDTILTWEVPGNWEFPGMWATRGIRWVNMVHWDWFAQGQTTIWQSATLLAPNRFCQRQLKTLGLEAQYLPVPVDTEKLEFRLRKKAERFVSLYAYGGQDNRRSIPEIFAAWGGLKDPPPLTLMAQVRPTEPEVAAGLPRGVSLRIGNVPEPGDIWTDGDVAVQPSRYEGVGLSMIEAQACGVPVIAVDAPPMDEVAPDLLVKYDRIEQVTTMGKSIPSHVPSVEGLRVRIDSLRGRDIEDLSARARARAELEFSWEELRPKWMKVLKG